MNVFAKKFLEKPSSDVVDQEDWAWDPTNPDATKIYATGASTNSNMSTYASEKDSRSDTDRPNEGMLFAA